MPIQHKVRRPKRKNPWVCNDITYDSIIPRGNNSILVINGILPFIIITKWNNTLGYDMDRGSHTHVCSPPF